MKSRWFIGARSNEAMKARFAASILLAMLTCGCRARDESLSVDRARERIESVYHEFHDFEHQRSFAGHDVATRTDGRDVYVAYKVLGSGLPVVKATCFCVNQQDGVRMVGRYPGPDRGALVDRDVDPRTCRGLR